MGGIELLHIIMEHGLFPEYTGILCIETEHNPDTQLVQTFQGFRIIRIFILLMEGIVEQPDNLTSLQGDLHLVGDFLCSLVNEKIQHVELSLEIR